MQASATTFFGIRRAVVRINTYRHIMTKINGSAYFCGDSKKDVWTVTNEAAAEAARDGNHKFSEFYNLGQGFFSYAPPEFMTEQGKKALENIPANQYSPVRGQPILVDALSKLYSPVYKKQLKPENIQVTTGANVGIFACLMSLLNPGDEVIVLEPFFDQYIYNIKILGGIVKHVPLTPPKDLKTRRTKGSEWTLDFDQFCSAISEKTKAVIINSPHNPTGKVFTREELLTLGNICVEKNVYIISDEVYENLYFTPECVKLASLSPEISNITLTIGSAGKIFAVTGWRIGWIISENVELLKLASSAHVKICFSSPSPPQLACAHAIDIALNSDYFDKMRKDYIEKVEILTSVFEELGMPYTVPEGSYFIVVDFSKLKIPEGYPFPQDLMTRGKDFRISHWLIKEIGLICLPCTDFYLPEHVKEAETLLRFAVCKENEYLEKAANRLRTLKEYL